MKKDILAKDCEIILCEVKLSENDLMVLPKIKFHHKYYDISLFTLSNDDSKLLSKIINKYLEPAEFHNNFIWKAKKEIPHKIIEMVVHFDNISSFAGQIAF